MTNINIIYFIIYILISKLTEYDFINKYYNHYHLSVLIRYVWKYNEIEIGSLNFVQTCTVRSFVLLIILIHRILNIMHDY